MLFDFQLGGYLDSNYRVTLRRDQLLCYRSLYSDLLIKPAVVQIKDSNEWLNVLNYLGTCRWKDYYDSPICDGQQWSLKVKSGELNIKSAGSNAYPGGFFKFLSLLNKVTSPTVGYWIK